MGRGTKRLLLKLLETREDDESCIGEKGVLNGCAGSGKKEDRGPRKESERSN